MCDTKEVLPDLPALEHQFAQLREMASKDALSGVLNRGMAEQYINQRLASLEPESLCALLIIDLDNFKQVNDTLGHQAGDQAIRRSARILSDLFRATDIVGRLGGDEFLVFLSGQITEALVRQKAQEICQRLQLAVGGDANLTVTASVGVYLARGGFRRFEDLYRSADLALYKAKKRGKHGYVIKSGDGLTEIAGEEFQPVSAIPLSGLLEQMESGVALLEMGSLLQLLYSCRCIFWNWRSLKAPAASAAMR